jgi:polyhydroxybutyrate depolymerase
MFDKRKIIIIIITFGLFFSSILLSGCTKPKQWISYDGRIRNYIIHIPSNYDAEEPIPLVLALHGGGGNSENMQDKTGFNQLANEEGFIVVYPDGTGRLINRLLTWNSGHCCGFAFKNDIDDVGFIRTLIEQIQQEFLIDTNKIFITGHSNGGMMAYRLGSELSDIVAAIAPVAGSIGGKATEDSEVWTIPEPSFPISVLAIHGLLDENVAYDGGRGNKTTGTRSDISVNNSIDFWVKYNNCNPIPEIEESGTIIIETYKEGDMGTEVVLCTLINGEHWWPGSEKDPYKEISASELIWEFFKTHPKQ